MIPPADTDVAGRPPGLDLARLRGYLDQTLPGLVAGDLTAELIAGGRSNLTYTVEDGRSRWVVRRPPLGHVLATAHDMSREVRVIRALAGTGVPVPTVVDLCEDPAVLGAPFYLMEHVPGRTYRSAADLRALGERHTEALSRRVVETLAELHAVDPAEVGLADFGRPEGFLPRQVRRWGTQLDASRSRPLRGIDELRAGLAARLPAEQPAAVVHGDYRLDNLLVDSDRGQDRVAAVLDWEMATLGDPLTDLGLLLVYDLVASDAPDLADASLAPGFLRGEQLLSAYAAASGRSLPPMGFYVALASFKLAVILEGIHYRHSLGQTAGEGFDAIGDAVDPLVSHGLDALRDA